MSISIDRFVRVMSGGVVVSDELVRVRHDKVQQGLTAIRDQMARVTQAGLQVRPPFIAQLQGLEQQLAAAMQRPNNQAKCDALEPLKEAFRIIAAQAVQDVDQVLVEAAAMRQKAAEALAAANQANQAIQQIADPAFSTPLGARLAAVQNNRVTAAAATMRPNIAAAVQTLTTCVTDANAIAADAARAAQQLAARTAKLTEIGTALTGLSAANGNITEAQHKSAADTAHAALTARRDALASAGPTQITQEMGRAAALLADIATAKATSDQRVAWCNTKARRDAIRKDADDYEAVGNKENNAPLKAAAAKLKNDLIRVETLSLASPKTATDQVPQLEADRSTLKTQFGDAVLGSQMVQKVKDLVATSPTGPEAQMQTALGTDKNGADVFKQRMLEVYKNAKFQGSPEINLLTPGEVVAINTYTTDDYQQMNGYLFGMNPLPPPKDPLLLPPTEDQVKIKNQQTIDALKKLPNWTGGVTRRGSGPFPNDNLEFALNNIFAIKAFWSTDKKQPFPGKWQIWVDGKTGKNVAMMSHYPKEDEVLFPPGTRFEVIDRDDSDPSSIEITVKEV